MWKKYVQISVIIPTWNGTKTLESVIKSCLNQTMPPIEILVCDDGSTDNSKNIVEQIKDPRVIWVPSLHSGTPAVPRNNGLKICKGEWIAFCDNDDEWLPTKLEKQIHLAETLKCRAVCTNALIKINDNLTHKTVSIWNKKKISFINLLKSNNVVCSSVMIHSSIYKEINGFTEIVEYGSFADYIYWLRVSTITDFAFVNEPLMIYDDHPLTSIRSSFTDGKLLKEKSLDNFIKWVKEQRKVKLYLYILYIKIHLVIEWIKKLLRNKIKTCLKK